MVSNRPKQRRPVKAEPLEDQVPTNKYAPKPKIGKPTIGKPAEYVETVGLGNLKVITANPTTYDNANV